MLNFNDWEEFSDFSDSAASRSALDTTPKMPGCLNAQAFVYEQTLTPAPIAAWVFGHFARLSLRVDNGARPHARSGANRFSIAHGTMTAVTPVSATRVG
jgi:hypothetical protein